MSKHSSSSPVPSHDSPRRIINRSGLSQIAGNLFRTIPSSQGTCPGDRRGEPNLIHSQYASRFSQASLAKGALRRPAR